jgi:PAS domain S-box-containing protein
MKNTTRRSTDNPDTALMETNALLRLAIDENPNIILMKDWDGKFLLGNRALAGLYGTTSEALVGKDDGDFNPNAEQVAFYLQNVREVMSQDKTQVVMEESTDAATGETLYYQSIKIPLTTPDGKRQLLVIANDVSELKRTQKKLEESERRLRYVLDATGEGVWDWDIATNIVTHNRRWCQIVGLDDNYLQHPLAVFAELLHADDKDRVMEKLQSCLAGKERYQSEHRMRLKNGQVVWVHDRGDVVERDALGKPLRVVGSFVDISARKAAELAAERANNLLKEAVYSIEQGFTIYDEQDRLYLCNEAYKRIYESSRDLLVPGNTFEMIVRAGAERGQYKEAIGHVDAWVQQRVAQHQLANGEMLEQQLADGRWLLIVESRTPSGFIVGNRIDITELKNTTQALSQSEQRWELAMSSVNDGIWDWNPQSGEVYFSKRWKSMLGYEENEIGSNVQEWILRVHPQDMDRTMAEVQRHLRGETDFYQSEHRMRCKNGDYKWILDRGRAYIDAQGKPIRMLGSHSDITERRSTQARVREHAAQLNAIFELSPDGFVTFDADRCVKYVNPAFTTLTGLTEIQLAGDAEAIFSHKLAQICIPSARFVGVQALRVIRIREAVGAAATDDKSLTRPRQVIELTDASKRVLEVSLRESHAESVSQILYLRDITHETEVDRLKTEFLSTAAHELRTPMASIYGFAEVLLKQKVGAAELQEFLGIIYRQSELMASILNELLDLARIEARRGKDFVIESLQAQGLVADVVNSFKLPAKRIAPQIDAPGTPLFLMADKKKALQAILNVLSNAYKYSSDLVHISIAQVGSNVTISVTDQGIGMTRGEIERVGERFYRADTSGKVPGTGLGMSIVTEIMNLHHGSVAIQSELGQGTTVTLAFPIQPLATF